MGYFCFGTLRGAPVVMGDAPPKEGDGVGRIRETCQVTFLRGLFPSLPMFRHAKQNLVISVVFLVALGLRGGPVG